MGYNMQSVDSQIDTINQYIEYWKSKDQDDTNVHYVIKALEYALYSMERFKNGDKK